MRTEPQDDPDYDARAAHFVRLSDTASDEGLAASWRDLAGTYHELARLQVLRKKRLAEAH